MRKYSTPYYLFPLTALSWALLLGLPLHSQSSSWNHRYLSINNIKDKSFSLRNDSDHTIKIKIFKYGESFKETVVGAGGYAYYTFPVSQFSATYLARFKVEVHYDEDCYEKDLRKLRSIANARKAAADRKQASQAGWRLLFGLAETAKEGSFWNNVGKFGNGAMDVGNIIQDIQDHGWANASLNALEGLARDKMIELAVPKHREQVVVKTLANLYDVTADATSYRTEDLEYNATVLMSLLRPDAHYTYGIDYDKTIQPVIDPDRDGITNSRDKCPNLFGEAKYQGCTRKALRDKKKAVARANRRFRRSTLDYEVELSILPLNYGNSLNEFWKGNPERFYLDVPGQEEGEIADALWNTNMAANLKLMLPFRLKIFSGRDRLFIGGGYSGNYYDLTPEKDYAVPSVLFNSSTGMGFNTSLPIAYELQQLHYDLTYRIGIGNIAMLAITGGFVHQKGYLNFKYAELNEGYSWAEDRVMATDNERQPYYGGHLAIGKSRRTKGTYLMVAYKAFKTDLSTTSEDYRFRINRINGNDTFSNFSSQDQWIHRIQAGLMFNF